MSRTERLICCAVGLGVGMAYGVVALSVPCDGGFWSGFKLAAGAHCPTPDQRFGCSMAESNRNGGECN